METQWQQHQGKKQKLDLKEQSGDSTDTSVEAPSIRAFFPAPFPSAKRQQLGISSFMAKGLTERKDNHNGFSIWGDRNKAYCHRQKAWEGADKEKSFHSSFLPHSSTRLQAEGKIRQSLLSLTHNQPTTVLFNQHWLSCTRTCSKSNTACCLNIHLHTLLTNTTFQFRETLHA